MSPVLAQSLPSSSDLPWTTIIIVIVLLVVIALVIALVLWLRKRRQNQEQTSTTGSGPGNQLARIYRPFYQQLPQSAQYYPTVVVMGEAGVGKSHLIDRHVDWRGQTNQFNPSATQASLMQLYLGAGVITQELSAPLLRDVSKDAEHALGRMWARLKKRPVTAVVVLDATQLTGASPDGLIELAQLMRGKLELIADQGRRSLSVRLCLTHLDRIEGYSGFSELLRSRNYTSRIDPTGEQLLVSDLNGTLVPFDSHLALALTTSTPDEFSEIIDFYRESPTLFQALSPFLYHLRGGDDPFAREYPIEGLYFSSANPEEFVGKPFTVDRSTIAEDINKSRKRHLTVCAAILAISLIAVAMLLAWHEGKVGDAETAVAEFTDVAAQESTPELTLNAAQKQAHDALVELAESEVLWLGGSFESRKETVDGEYRDALRSRYLLPIVETSRDRGQLLYAGSLIYAASDSALGAYIKADPKQWVNELDVPKRVILDYIQVSPTAWDEKLSLPGLDEDDSEVPKKWSDFLKELDSQTGKERISEKKLGSLQETVTSELRLGSEQRYQDLNALAAVVAEDSDIRIYLESLLYVQPSSQWVSKNYEQLRAVSRLVQQSSLGDTPKSIADWDLGRLLAELREVAPAPAQSTPKTSGTGAASDTGTDPAAGADASADSGADSSPQKSDGSDTGTDASASSDEPQPIVYQFELSDRTIEIEVASWDDLLKRSRAGLLIDGFITEVDTSTRSPFFLADVYYPNAGAVRGTTRGPASFIPGVYTRRAFDSAMLPVLTDMSGGLTDIMLADGDRINLDSYAVQNLTEYASEYGQEIDSYYKSFTFGSPSLDELIFELQSMSKPSGWFVSYLRTVSDNANLSLSGTGKFFDPMTQAVEPYQSFVALLTEDSGQYPQLDPYLTILSDLATTLEGNPDGAAAGGEGGEGGATDTATALELNTAGTLALPVVLGTDKPLTNTVRAFLATAAIETSYQRPFLAPVQRAYNIGYVDIETSVASAWNNQIMGELQPLLDRYPFDKRADSEADIADIESWFLPSSGRFWQEFATYIEPVCRKQRGRWRMRSPIGAPKGMLRLINRATTMRDALWDEKDNPLPLVQRITPQPLPTDVVDGRVATLAYLKSGSSVIYGFNQKPQTQTLSVTWSNQGAAAIGVQMRTPNNESSKTGSLDVIDSAWSYYRLLEKAQIVRSVATFTVPVPSSRSATQTLELTLELGDDPWALFDLQ